MATFKKHLFYSFLFTTILGSLSHFLYSFSNSHFLIGLFSPINESVWEHLKMLYFPSVLSLIFLYRNYSHHYPNLLTSFLFGLLYSLYSIISIYYTYTSGFAIEAIWIDILLFIACCLVEHVIVYLICSRHHVICLNNKLCILLLGIVGIAFILFTIAPPNLPVFTPLS